MFFPGHFSPHKPVWRKDGKGGGEVKQKQLPDRDSKGRLFQNSAIKNQDAAEQEAAEHAAVELAPEEVAAAEHAAAERAAVELTPEEVARLPRCSVLFL